MANNYGALFDLDGTLVDNEHLKALSFSKAINELGGNSSPDIYKEVMGMSGPVIRDRFLRTSNLQVDSEAYFDLYKSIYEDLLIDGLIICPGAEEFLSKLKSAGFLMAIVSGSYRRSVEWIINKLQIAHYFDIVITGDDVTNKKPDPECYLIALEKLNISIADTVVYEDSEAGIIACQNAGLKSFGIRHAYNQSHDFSSAINEYASFEDDRDLILKDLRLIFEKANL